ncbi:MAG: putative porin [Bacteroidia bacterium]
MPKGFKKIFFQSIFFLCFFANSIYASPKDSLKTHAVKQDSVRINPSKYISEIKVYNCNFFSEEGKFPAYDKDTVKLNYFISSTSDKNEIQVLENFSRIDTSLINFQRYTSFYNLGNSGTPLVNLFLPHYSDVEDGFHYDNDFMDSYRITNNSINYYNTKAPYTELYAVVGAKEEQFFKLLHTQNVNKNLNFCLNFNRVRSAGSYLNQNSNDNSLALSSCYKTTNKKYFLTSNIIYNNFQYAENGGITNDSALGNATFSNRQLVAVNLSAAKHRIIDKEFNVRQTYFFGSTTETMKSDSSFEKNFFPKSSLTHTFSIGDKSIVYQDNFPDSNFYKNAIDTKETLDSVRFYHIENELAWNTWNNNFDFTAKIKDQIIGLKQGTADSLNKHITTDSVFSNVIAGGNILFKKLFFENSFLDVSGNYDLLGNRKGDYSGKISWGIIPFVDITASIQHQTPDYIYDLYAGNNFNWKNNFQKTDCKSITIDHSYFKENGKTPFIIGVSAAQYTHFCYFDNYAQPEQYSGNITVSSAYLKKDFVYKRWTFSNDMTYQYVPDSLPLRLPKFISQNALYYSSNYKKILYFSLGVDLFYTSAYNGSAYMPATGQFYLQNTNKIGDYPYLDLFLNAKIKTVRIFVKYQHANSGLTGYNYYTAYHYPMPDNAIKFGLSWQFAN